jgi:arylsulfatase
MSNLIYLEIMNQSIIYLLVVLTWVNYLTAERPNVILIMVDDMGFSDLGYHGGEIETPNLDALAHGGVRFSQFYNSGRCCPTRATLMTGLHPHQVGIGHMTQSPLKEKKGVPPAYVGHLNRTCVTIADVLKQHGYATMMAGKWHLGFNDQDDWPLQRGYEKYYGCISGATRFFYPEYPRGMTFGNQHLERAESTTDEAFYTTDAFTDYAIQFMNEELQSQKRPMFLYLAYTAPHWPLQAFEDDISKYRGKYKQGWDKIRQQRYHRQLESGLIQSSSKLSPRADRVPAWDSLSPEKQDEMDLKMAIYAAMIDRVDQNVGKLVKFLKAEKLFENTLILFLSDNGGCAEGGVMGRGEFYDRDQRNQEHSNAYGEAWANVSSTPFRLYKHYTHEGGAATPFFMHYPKKIKAQKHWYREPAQLIDVMPTILDVSQSKYPSVFKGQHILNGQGISLRPAFQSKELQREKPIFIEHENNASIRQGKWKLVGKGVSSAKGIKNEKWELYDLSVDRTELNNLVKVYPEKVEQMSKSWHEWSLKAKVFPKKK